jgi:hypothetical protein
VAQVTKHAAAAVLAATNVNLVRQLAHLDGGRGGSSSHQRQGLHGPVSRNHRRPAVETGSSAAINGKTRISMAPCDPLRTATSPGCRPPMATGHQQPELRDLCGL